MSSLTVATVQTDLFWENKEANLNRLEDRLANLRGMAELVVLPEMFSTGFSMQPEKLAETMDGPTVQWMKQISARNNFILTGSLIIQSGDAYYNRLIWMMPNGELGYYDKRHLFGFAEEDKHYTPGNKRLIASVKGWRVLLQVCYDLRFPVWARQQINPETAAPEYDLIVYVANWPQRRSHAWKTLLCARAIENQSYVIGVNRVGSDGHQVYHSGDSLIIDPMGEVLYHMPDREDVFTITLEKSMLEETRQKLPFLKDADSFRIL
jgi:predicted amidohydrolase